MQEQKVGEILIHKNRFLNKILNWDFRNFAKIYFINDKITHILKIFSFFGSYPAYAILTGLLVLTGENYDIELAKVYGYMLFTAGTVISFMILSVPKYIIRRNRPYNEVKIKDLMSLEIKNRDRYFGVGKTQSFPSGHVFFWGFQTVLLSYLFGIWTLSFSIPILIAMCFTRIHLGCHYPTDVLVGCFLGILSGIITILFYFSFFYPSYIYIWNILETSFGF